jgi:dienelactone hydrolase
MHRTFFKDFKGWKKWARRKYWGFDVDKLPLNARVWYPEGAGPFPLALIVHGNHDMAEFSDPGYAYLGELLASRGFILASIDENFLNSGLFHDPPKQQQVRGWMLLEHLKLWREWNQAAGNPFRGKVDMAHIALMGHSRGGEAAATAALFNRLRYYPDNANIRFDYGFAIQAVVAIAPADGQYKPAGQHRWIEDVSYSDAAGRARRGCLVVHGQPPVGSRAIHRTRSVVQGGDLRVPRQSRAIQHGLGPHGRGRAAELVPEPEAVDAGRRSSGASRRLTSRRFWRPR